MTVSLDPNWSLTDTTEGGRDWSGPPGARC